MKSRNNDFGEILTAVWIRTRANGRLQYTSDEDIWEH